MNRHNRSQGELAIIDYLKSRFPRRHPDIIKGIGDDAMVLRPGYAISTDSFVDTVHFDRRYFDYRTLGYRTLSASLSDIAAMAAEPVAALISLQLPGGISLDDIKLIYHGFNELSRKYGFDIAGGDIVGSPCLGITITVIGRCQTPLLRSGAKPGQYLYVTNFLGLAEVGRNVLAQDLMKSRYETAVNRHRFPEPRFAEVRAIRKYASAAIDTSDGLSTDAYHLMRESKVKVVIDGDHVPIHSEVGAYCQDQNIDPLTFILEAGEDFELLFSAGQLPATTGCQVFQIGRIMRGKGLFIVRDGRESALEPGGYQHLNAPVTRRP